MGFFSGKTERVLSNWRKFFSKATVDHSLRCLKIRRLLDDKMMRGGQATTSVVLTHGGPIGFELQTRVHKNKFLFISVL